MDMLEIVAGLGLALCFGLVCLLLAIMKHGMVEIYDLLCVF